MQLSLGDLKKNIIFCPSKHKKKKPQKVAYLWQLEVFFSAAPTAQNSPELHFSFINSFIQPSLVGSLAVAFKGTFYTLKKSHGQPH